MPVRSAKQWGAMAAAAHGKSTLGIPKKVGQEFVKKTSPEKRSAFAKALGRIRSKRGR